MCCYAVMLSCTELYHFLECCLAIKSCECCQMPIADANNINIVKQVALWGKGRLLPRRRHLVLDPTGCSLKSWLLQQLVACSTGLFAAVLLCGFVVMLSKPRPFLCLNWWQQCYCGAGSNCVLLAVMVLECYCGAMWSWQLNVCCLVAYLGLFVPFFFLSCQVSPECWFISIPANVGTRWVTKISKGHAGFFRESCT